MLRLQGRLPPKELHCSQPLIAATLKVLLQKVDRYVIEVQFADDPTECAVNGIVEDSVFELVCKLKEGWFFGNPNRTTVADYVDSIVGLIVKPLDPHPAAHPLLNSSKSR
jgi:hypothetical protein